MTHPALIERITRSLAYMLRHQPEEFDLELDAQGYGDAERIVQALNERLGEPVTMADLDDAIHSGDRPRYEIVGTRVRALYGHSIDVEPGEASRPPEVLHVGISARDADRAMRYGLRGGRRRFLHLALTPDDAKEGGRRTGRDYVVVTVYALDAWEEGINFFDRKALFLAEQIPIEFLEIGETCHDGTEPEMRGPGARREHTGDRHRGGSQRPPMREREALPPQEPRVPENYEEEGFGDGGSEAIQVQRERGPQPVSSGDAGFPRDGGGRGESRGGRGSRGGSRHAGDRGRSDEPQQTQNFSARSPQAGERAPGWGGGPPAGAPNVRGERDSRSVPGDRQPDRSRSETPVGRTSPDASSDRAPREARRESGFERRDFERDGRPERQPDRNQRPAERSDRPTDQSRSRGERGFERGDRPDRNTADRQAPLAPMHSAASPERTPQAKQIPEKHDSSSGFGLGIFEEFAAQKRQAPAAPRPVAPPPAPAPPAARERDASDGFGAGI